MLIAVKEALVYALGKETASYNVNTKVTVSVIPVHSTPSRKTSTISAVGNQNISPRRYVIAVLGFLSFVVLNTQRVNLPIALMAMKNSSARSAPESIEDNSTRATIVEEAASNWGSAVDGYIMSSAFTGFVVTQIPGGRLSEILGAKFVLTLSVFLSSLSNILCPSALVGGVYLLVAAQFVKGMAQGLIQPAVSCLMSRWYPRHERSFLTAATFSGFPAGALLGGIGSGALCDSSFLGGWPSAFYTFGFLGLVLMFFLPILVHDSPEEYDRRKNSILQGVISEKETSAKKRVNVPWSQMAFSIQTWALFVGMFGQYWMTFYFISVHPAYLASVLNFNVTESGILASLPYIAQIVVMWTGSYISDWLVKKNYVAMDTARKTYNTLSCFVFSASMLSVAFAGRSHTLNIICFFIALSSVGLGYSGSLTAPLDMTKDFAGTLMGLSCTVASVSGFIVPMVMGHVTNHQQTIAEWNIILYVSVAIVMSSALIFHLFGSAELQEWGVPIIETEGERFRKKSQISIKSWHRSSA